MHIRPLTWWIVFLTLVLGGAGLYVLLQMQGFEPVGRLVVTLANVLSTGWLIFGLVRWREDPWVRRIGLLLAFTFVAQLLATTCYVLGSTNGMIATLGIWAMAVLFVGGLLLMRLVLAPGHPVLGVARTLVDEAVRMKAPLVFLVVLVLIVPVLPFVLDPEDQLRYRIQTFLTWSLTATSALLSLMTIFLAVGTITGEVQNRQIFLTMTKPVGRASYLFGKWLGIAALNLVLVAVCGAGIYAFTTILARQPAQSDADARAIEEQVLVARQAVAPVPANVDLPVMFRARLDTLRRSDPATYGPAGTPVELLAPTTRGEIQKQVLNELFVVPPKGLRAFRFDGLNQGELGQTVQFRVKPRPATSLPDGTAFLYFGINGYPYPGNPVRLAEGQFHTIEIPTQDIIDPAKGELLIEIANPGRPGRGPNGEEVFGDQPSITFDVNGGMEVLYKVGGFEPNFVRGLVMMWVRLSFLAMLGLAAGAYLSFPIACLLALVVYFAAIGSSYIAESLDSYASFAGDNRGGGWEWISGFFGQFAQKAREGEVFYLFKMVIKLIGSGFLALVPRFSEYNPTDFVTDGRWISPRYLGEAALWVGVVWTGVAAFFAWLVWHRRELARVTV